MTKIRLHNSRTRKRDDFVPLDPDNVRMYVCGPTVYDRAHLGNARPVVVFDVLYRLLRHVYGAEHVTYVRNFTDVDDKINARAAKMQAEGDARPLNAIVQALTDETIGWYHADMDALGALRPDHEPRATQFITQMIAMIDGLIAKGHAYEVSGHVLFDVRSYPDYGRLSGRSVDDMIAGARVEVAPYKRDPMDFVLWKPSDAGLPGWDSPWGRGRPGWHIECSAMSHELLGASFDIHGGGIDLQFPHHENEIAQSCCAFPDAGFARYWLHNEMVQVDGKKMSKSLGNFFTVRDLLEQGWPGEVIRFVMLSTHYRSPMDWTEEKAEDAKATLTKWRRMLKDIEPSVPSSLVTKALFDDLNTHEALADCHRQFGLLHAYENGADLPEFGISEAYSVLLASLNMLGLLHPETANWHWQELTTEPFQPELGQLLELRFSAKVEKNFAKADEIRDFLSSLGFVLKDHSTGTKAEISYFDLMLHLPDAASQPVRLTVFAEGSEDLGKVSAILKAKMRTKLEALK
ncbi:MAG: cysteine--tRNA ligase [Rhodobacteraceae bacterium]|nr:cysteine--tRNA ligase [Paracoccaceae bacterium]